MGLRILYATSSNMGSPWLSAHAANACWLPDALRARGHDVTVRVLGPGGDVPGTDLATFDIVHFHDSTGSQTAAPDRNMLETGYAAGARRPGVPWIALSVPQERHAGVSAIATFPPAMDTSSVPHPAERTDALAFGFDGHDDYALGAAISVASRTERPLDVVMAATAVPGEACEARLMDAQAKGFVRVHRVARDEFPAAIAGAAAYLAFSRMPFDMGALTAMACGTPVITFTGMPAAAVIVGGESGFVCEHPEDAARVIERLHLLQPGLGRSRAAVVFDAAASAARHEALYERLLAGDGVLRIDPRAPRAEPQREMEPAAVA